jgi:TIR domain-containing protein
MQTQAGISVKLHSQLARMKVFISWSGSLSKQVALLLRSWIEDVLQGTETWISADDIDKGSIWFGDISEQLASTSVGILCLTQDNQDSNWVQFEAGALSKGLSKSRVCPFLINLGHADLKPPLSLFNGTLPTKDDLLKLIKTINAENGERGLSEDRVEKAFEKWWDTFEADFRETLAQHKPKKEVHRRSTEEMLDQILEAVRSIQRAAQTSAPEQPHVVLQMKAGSGKTATAETFLKYLEEKKLRENPKGKRSLREILDILEKQPSATEQPPEESTGVSEA